MALKDLWLQQAHKRMERKGTVGAFTRWCIRHGFKGVTSACIREAIRIGKKTKNITLIRRAIFARNVRKINK